MLDQKCVSELSNEVTIERTPMIIDQHSRTSKPSDDILEDEVSSIVSMQSFSFSPLCLSGWSIGNIYIHIHPIVIRDMKGSLTRALIPIIWNAWIINEFIRGLHALGISRETHLRRKDIFLRNKEAYKEAVRKEYECNLDREVAI